MRNAYLVRRSGEVLSVWDSRDAAARDAAQHWGAIVECWYVQRDRTAERRFAVICFVGMLVIIAIATCFGR
jgi:hypothetical protein